MLTITLVTMISMEVGFEYYQNHCNLQKMIVCQCSSSSPCRGRPTIVQSVERQRKPLPFLGLDSYALRTPLPPHTHTSPQTHTHTHTNPHYITDFGPKQSMTRLENLNEARSYFQSRTYLKMVIIVIICNLIIFVIIWLKRTNKVRKYIIFGKLYREIIIMLPSPNNQPFWPFANFHVTNWEL